MRKQHCGVRASSGPTFELRPGTRHIVIRQGVPDFASSTGFNCAKLTLCSYAASNDDNNHLTHSPSAMTRPSTSPGLLPVPGSAGASWPLFRARLTSFFRNTDTAVLVAFWLFGLINNVIYVIILSAAQDLVGDLPKGIVLLAGSHSQPPLPFVLFAAPLQQDIFCIRNVGAGPASTLTAFANMFALQMSCLPS
jgi:hypothetical protein